MYFLKSRFIETKTHKKTILMQSCLQYVQWQHRTWAFSGANNNKTQTLNIKPCLLYFCTNISHWVQGKIKFKIAPHKSVLLKRYLKNSLKLLSSKLHFLPSGQALALIHGCLGYAQHFRMLFLWLVTNANFLFALGFFCLFFVFVFVFLIPGGLCFSSS